MNEQGYSLIEVMTGAAIVSVMMLSLIKLQAISLHEHVKLNEEYFKNIPQWHEEDFKNNNCTASAIKFSNYKVYQCEKLLLDDQKETKNFLIYE